MSQRTLADHIRPNSSTPPREVSDREWKVIQQLHKSDQKCCSRPPFRTVAGKQFPSNRSVEPKIKPGSVLNRNQKFASLSSIELSGRRKVPAEKNVPGSAKIQRNINMVPKRASYTKLQTQKFVMHHFVEKTPPSTSSTSDALYGNSSTLSEELEQGNSGIMNDVSYTNSSTGDASTELQENGSGATYSLYSSSITENVEPSEELQQNGRGPFDLDDLQQNDCGIDSVDRATMNNSSTITDANDNSVTNISTEQLNSFKSDASTVASDLLDIGESQPPLLQIDLLDKVFGSCNLNGEGDVSRSFGHQCRSHLMEELVVLQNKCAEWNSIIGNKIGVPEPIICEINALNGKVGLLVRGKLLQFRSLIDQFEDQESTDHCEIKEDDLRGFWDLTLIEIHSILSYFERLHALKENGWKEVSSAEVENKKHLNPKPNTKKNKIESKIKLAIQAAREANRKKSIEPVSPLATREAKQSEESVSALVTREAKEGDAAVPPLVAHEANKNKGEELDKLSLYSQILFADSSLESEENDENEFGIHIESRRSQKVKVDPFGEHKHSNVALGDANHDC